MHPISEHQQLLTRRHFFGRTATGIGTAALASLLNPLLFAEDSSKDGKKIGIEFLLPWSVDP